MSKAWLAAAVFAASVALTAGAARADDLQFYSSDGPMFIHVGATATSTVAISRTAAPGAPANWSAGSMAAAPFRVCGCRRKATIHASGRARARDIGASS